MRQPTHRACRPSWPKAPARLAGSSPLTATLTTSGRSSSWPPGPGRRPPRGPTTRRRCRWHRTAPCGHGDRLQVGAVGLDVVHLRGHTEGGVALAYADPAGFTHLFTGDSLFPGGVGNTKMPGQSFEQLYADVTARIFNVYDDATWVYPGHGDDTTLGVERPHLGEWLARGW
jgi:glyoxylase-like metal-dependent hydrolase (beta-lactamase superfamily II)